MNEGRLLADVPDGFELPRRVCLEAVLNFLELSFVFFWSLATPRQYWSAILDCKRTWTFCVDTSTPSDL